MKTTSTCSGPVYAAALGRRSFVQVGMLGRLGLSLGSLFPEDIWLDVAGNGECGGYAHGADFIANAASDQWRDRG